MIHTRTGRSIALFLFSIFLSGILPPQTLPATEARRKYPEIRKTVLSNGMVLLHAEERTLPFVTCRVLVRAGSWRDPSGKEGLANLTASSILLGTSNRSLYALNRELDRMGASLSVSCGRDFAVVRFRSLKKHLGKALPLLMNSLTDPQFPGPEVERQKAEVLAAIQAQLDQPQVVAEREFRKVLFRKSPYRHPEEGTPQSVRALSRDDAGGFHRAYYAPNNSIFAAAGDMTEAELKKSVIPLLEKWPKKNVPETPFENEFAPGPKLVKIDRSLTQASIVLGHRGIARGDEDYYAASLMNYILGGSGLGSRLMQEIRIKRGLAYAVDSAFIALKRPDSFQIVLQTKNTSAKEAVQVCLEEMKRMQAAGVKAEELEGAKKYHIGSFPMRLDSQAELSEFMALMEFYELGLDYPERYPALIRAVTPEAVRAAARKYLQPDRYVLSLVGDLKQAALDVPPR